ncbi:MAG TPA: hypothetical protein DDY49_15220 [Paenibacillaceae bacterium]|nr:hypothetical protein [Paenibacillaceae bacterium]
MEELMNDNAFRFAMQEIKLIPSKGGVFEVTVDGKLAFSKKSLGRHANPGEIVELIRKMIP